MEHTHTHTHTHTCLAGSELQACLCRQSHPFNTWTELLVSSDTVTSTESYLNYNVWAEQRVGKAVTLKQPSIHLSSVVLTSEGASSPEERALL
jgi:hypothetical protein